MHYSNLVFENAAPEIFGTKHLIGTALIFLAIAALLYVLLLVLKNTNHRRVLQIASVFLISLELMKYTYAFVVYGQFPLYFIPMQLCSFSLYLTPLVAFGSERVRRFIAPIAYPIGLMAGLITLSYPATVLGGAYSWLPLSENILPIISFLYHGTMIFFSLYLVLSKTYVPQVKDFGRAYLGLVVFASMAVVTNAVFGTDMMFLNDAHGSPLQFVLLEKGRLVYMAVMMGVAALLLLLPYSGSAIRLAYYKIRNAV